MRWIVGDVQGCAAELEDLLEAVGFDPGRDELLSAGDLVNRGPDSLGALRLWRDVGGRGVLGNHDLHLLAIVAGRRETRPKDTLGEILADPDRDALLDRLRELPILVHLPGDGGPDAWLVHGGLHPRWHDLDAVAARLETLGRADDAWLEHPEVRYAVNVRCCLPDGTFDAGTGPVCDPPYRPWDSLYRGRTLVVHGHWATRGHYRGARTLGLDSGCVYGGPLTAWCQQEDRIVQVPSRRG